MKIIAHISSDAVMVQMSRRELAQIHGKDYDHEMNTGSRYSTSNGFEVGLEYDVGFKWGRLRAQEQIADRMNSAAESLRALAGLLETIKPIAAEVLKQPETGV